jgi:hypothetical protein
MQIQTQMQKYSTFFSFSTLFIPIFYFNKKLDKFNPQKLLVYFFELAVEFEFAFEFAFAFE